MMRSRRDLFRYLIIALLGVFFLSTSTTLQPTQAQTDPEAEINRLATALHIQNLRWGRSTHWIAGNLGTPSYEANPDVGQQLTNWTLTDMDDQGITFDMGDIERPVVMNLWASWCGPCVIEFPLLTEYAERDDLNFDLWFVNTGDTSLAAGQRFLRDQSDILTTMYDPNDRFAASLGLRAYPTTLLIDTDGTIIATHAGIVTHTAMDFFNALAAAPRAGGIDTSTIEFNELDFLQPIDTASATPLIYNQQMAGILSGDDWRDDFSFTGSADETITINLTYVSDEIEAYLTLIGPNGEIVRPNLDRSSNDVSGISLSVTLPQDGTYHLVVVRFLEADGFGEGGYNIIINNAATVSNAGNALLIRSGVASTGILTYERKQEAYTLDVFAGQTVTFTLSHDLPEEEVSLQARMGSTRLVPYTKTAEGLLEVVATVEEAGTYSVYVARSTSSRAGPITYTLLVTIDGDAPETPNAPAGGDEDGSIIYGDTISGTIDDATFEHRYTFEGAAGDVIDLRMSQTSGDLDPVLQLLDVDGVLLAENDDVDFTTTNSAISNVELPADGTYTVVAMRYQGEAGTTSGDFELTLAEALEVVDTPTDTTISIAYGESVTGTIDNDNVSHRYEFEGDAGDTISIVLDGSGTLDTYLLLQNPAGDVIVENDDVELTTTDAGLRGFELPASGTYTIVATRFQQENGLSMGNFTLTLILGDALLDTPDVPTISDGNLGYGDSITGTLNDAVFEQRFSFDGMAGDVVTIEVSATSGGLDTALTLVDPDGETIAENDDIDFLTTDSAIEDVVLPATGAYTIVVSRFNGETGRTSGDFLLQLDGESSDIDPTIDTPDIPITPTGESVAIAYGDRVIAGLNDETFERAYTFEGTAGDVVTIDVISNEDRELDANLTLLDADGVVVAANDDRDLFTGNLNPLIDSLELPATGTYTIIVGRYLGSEGPTSGEFTLTLGLTDAGVIADFTLTYNDTVEGRIDSQTYQVFYRFEGQAGDSISAVIRATSGDLDSTLLLSDSNGDFLAFNDDFDGLNSAIIDVVLPSDGVYTLTVSRYLAANGSSAGDYELTLTAETSDVVIDVPDTPDTPPSTTTDDVLTFTGTIDNTNFAQTFTFDAQAGDLVTIRLVADSGTLDPLLILEGPNSSEVARNDDESLTSTDSLLPDLTLSQSGTYTVIATRYQSEGGLSTGTFTLTIDITRSDVVISNTLPTVPSVPNGVPAEVISIGETVDGTINADNLEDRYVFEGTAGQTVTIIMSATSGSLDPYISLMTAEGVEIAFNDDDIKAVGNDAVILAFKLPADGIYTIVATRYGVYYGVTIGDYELSLTE